VSSDFIFIGSHCLGIEFLLAHNIEGFYLYWHSVSSEIFFYGYTVDSDLFVWAHIV